MFDHRGMNIRQIANFVIRPTLTYIGQDMPGFASDAAVELLLGTMAHESRFEFVDQITGPNDTKLGPAIGFYQIEPATCRDIFETYLNASSRRGLCDRVLSLLAARPAMDEQLAGNLNFATAIARLKYWRSPEQLASPGDIAGHARVWKRVYNTVNGAGREADFINAYQRLVAPNL